MKVARNPNTGKYWVIPEPTDPPGVDPMGPYPGTRDGKREAEEDTKGVERFLANEGKPGYVTCEKRRGR